MAKKDNTMLYVLGAGALAAGYYFMNKDKFGGGASATNTSGDGSGGSSGGSFTDLITNRAFSQQDVKDARGNLKDTKEQIKLERKVDRINNRADKKIKKAEGRARVREARQSGQVKWYQFGKKRKIRKGLAGTDDYSMGYIY